MTRPINPTDNPEPGDADGRCRARTSSGRPCRNAPIRGARVCRVHGGSAPQVRRVAERRVARAEALRAAERVFGTPLQGELHPDAIVLEQIAHCAGSVAWLRGKVAELDADALVFGTTVVDDRQSGVGRQGRDTRREAKPNVWLELYGQERDRLLRMCETAHRMGIEQRQTQLAELLGGQLAELLSGVLDELRLTQEQRLRARELVPARLRAITGGMG